MFKKGLIASFIVTSITGLSGCDLLGLGKDEEVAAPPPVILPPDLVVPEPLEPIPVPRVLFLRGLITMIQNILLIFSIVS